MRISRLALAGVLAVGTLPVASCAANDDEDQPAPVETADTSADSVSGPVTAAPPDSAARPDRIYYDLTRFEWYARGEPLVFDGVFYKAGGDIEPIDARTVERVGEYAGVDVYRRGADRRLYVPVYDGYWLGFDPLAASAAPDTP